MKPHPTKEKGKWSWVKKKLTNGSTERQSTDSQTINDCQSDRTTLKKTDRQIGIWKRLTASKLLAGMTTSI